LTASCAYSAKDLFDTRLGTLNAKLRMLRDVAAGLAHLHSQSIVHRDVALRNVLLRADGSAQVADLGLARVLREGEQDTTKAAVPQRWSAPVGIY
jgi:serine/threonine protein kinase